jgi:pimeloyl-ACP methyl ester carboxylesterase
VKLLLLHGLPLDERMWEPQQQAFADEHELVAPNLYRLGGASMDVWAMALLREVWGEFAIVGASMGGYCALALARLAPERIRGLVLSGSRADPDTPERKEGRFATIGQVQQRGAEALWEQMAPGLTAGADDAAAERMRAIALEQAPDDLVLALRAIRDRPDSTDVLEAIDAPVLVVVGEDDPLVSADEAKAMAKAAKHGRAAVVEGAGHMPSVVAAETFNAELAEFLGKLE